MISKVNSELVESYLRYIKDCLNGSNQEISPDNSVRNYFYQIYNVNEYVEEDMEHAFDQSVHEQSDIDINEEQTIQKREKRSEKSNELTNEEKEWIRQEISRGKLSMISDSGVKGSIFRCTISKSCNYVSNSSPGLRYHLIIKHLKDRTNIKEERETEDIFLTTPLNVFKTNSGKNCCVECCLKFKDSRSYQLHEKCHELFQVVGQHSSFPMCNTCNIKFIEIESLNIHLERHEIGEDLKAPVKVINGAVREQGKLLKTAQKTSYMGETSDNEYSWKCGHCEAKNFTNEEYCNFHMLLAHVVNFSCPIDRMEFSGFKSVSLFIHHLRNKHPELFPNLSFKCTFCHMEFSTIYDKLQHMKNCDSKQLQCDHCEKRFFKKTDLAAHLKLVSGEVQYECELFFIFKDFY